MFLLKFAIKSIKENRKMYSPFFYAGVLSFVIYFLIYTVGGNESIISTVSSVLFDRILTMGMVVSAVIVTVFLFLANSYLFRTKKKMLGVYNTLGMAKKHLIVLTFWEMLMIAAAVIVFGTVLGNILSIVLFRIMSAILKSGELIVWHFSSRITSSVMILFAFLYLLIWLFNSYTIMRSKSIHLLKGEQQGEEAPSGSKIKALAGIILLIGGYYLAASTASPIQAANRIFYAVLLIVGGIYLFFVYSSVVILNGLKRVEKIYLQVPNFICISNLLSRMKKNAVGMACICLLGTAVITISSATISLYAGLTDRVNDQYVKDVMLYVSKADEQDIAEISQIIENYISENNGLGNQIGLVSYATDCRIVGNEIENDSDISFLDKNYGIVHFLDVESYNSLANVDVELDENQIMIFSNNPEFQYDNVIINATEYTVVDYLTDMPIYDTEDSQLAKSYYIICDSLLTAQSHYLTGKEEGSVPTVSYVCGIDMDSASNREQLVNTLNSYMNGNEIRGEASSRDESYEWQLEMYSAFLFVGIAFSILFIVMMAYVVYYKQISEGYEDQKKFKVMRNVGIAEQDIKRITRQQVLLVFFMPLLFSLVNMCFAYRVIVKFLMLLNLTNTTLFALCTIITAIIFIVVYGGIYFLTTKQYTDIVSIRKQKA